MTTSHKARKTKSPETKHEKVEIGSGNVFADLGFEDSEERLLKAKLASRVAHRSNRKGGCEQASRSSIGNKRSSDG
jgi:hypothetical protein